MTSARPDRLRPDRPGHLLQARNPEAHVEMDYAAQPPLDHDSGHFTLPPDMRAEKSQLVKLVGWI